MSEWSTCSFCYEPTGIFKYQLMRSIIYSHGKYTSFVIRSSYETQASWCSRGWSHSQMVSFIWFYLWLGMRKSMEAMGASESMFYDAPACIIITVAKGIFILRIYWYIEELLPAGPARMMDIGLCAENILLSIHAKGLAGVPVRMWYLLVLYINYKFICSDF